LGLPIVLVVGLRLGCLNHAQLSVRAIRDDGLMLAGWVANAIDPDFERRAGNLATLKDRLRAPFLGEIPWRTGITAEAAGERLDVQSLIKLLKTAQAG
jgi:dethiobiotin synthetase